MPADLILNAPAKIIKGAKFSDCEQYRYELWRIWDHEKPRVLFIMLNPSTADDCNDDPTIRRCIGFAKRYGFGGLHVCNLFALRATNPQELYQANNPYGPDNHYHVRKVAILQCNKSVICAWGNHGSLHGAGDNMLWNFKNLWGVDGGVKARCFGLTKKGQPKHPLYLKSNEELVDMRAPMPSA